MENIADETIALAAARVGRTLLSAAFEVFSSRMWRERPRSCGVPVAGRAKAKVKGGGRGRPPHTYSSSVGGDVLGGKRLYPAAGGAVGRQAGIANLVQQRAVADAQSAGRLLAVPVVGLQNFQNDLALQLASGLAGNLLQRDRTVEVQMSGVGNSCLCAIRSLLMTSSLPRIT